MNNAIEIKLPDTVPSKFEREKTAFFRLLPSLLTTHLGQYVAIHEEKVVDCGTDQFEVALRVQRRVGSVPIFVHLVAKSEPPVCRSGLLREIG